MFLLQSGSGLSLLGRMSPSAHGRSPGSRPAPRLLPSRPGRCSPPPCAPGTHVLRRRGRPPRRGVRAAQFPLAGDFSCVHTLEGRSGACRQRDSGENKATFVCRSMNRTVSAKHDCVKFLESGQAPASEYGVWCAGMRGCPAGSGAAASPPARTSVLSWEVLTCRGLCR